MTNVKNKILNIVETNKVKMIPKWKFVLYSALGIFGLVFSVLALIFLASLVMFLLATSGFMYMPLFGLQETFRFLVSIPVILFLVAVVMLFVTEALARQHEFAFKKPVMITLLSITFLSLVVGFFLSRTPFHFIVRDYMREHHFEMMRGIYDRPLPFDAVEGMTVIKGTLLSTSSNAIEVRMFDGAVVSVKATGTFPLPIFLDLGSNIVLFGVTNEDSVFEAFRIRPLGQGRGAGMMRDGQGYGQGMMREINQGVR